jgi:hypothetical protein
MLVAGVATAYKARCFYIVIEPVGVAICISKNGVAKLIIFYLYRHRLQTVAVGDKSTYVSGVYPFLISFISILLLLFQLQQILNNKR